MDAPEKVSLTAPLALPDFRLIWSANVVSNLGTIIQGVGAAWLMTELTQSTTMVGLVQTSAALPFFLVTLPAGALADITDRKKLLLWSQAWMLLAGTSLGALTLLRLITPWTLLGLTFAIGLGSALALPVLQAAVQDIVPPRSLPSAVSLNSISFNVARAVGPAAGGIIVAAAGAAFAFFAYAVSLLSVLLAVWRWKPSASQQSRPEESVLGSICSGLRHLLRTPQLRAPLIRSAAFSLCAAAVWTLLPLLSWEKADATAADYGTLLSVFGLGSIIAAVLLPRLRALFPLDRILAAGTLLAALAFACLSQSRSAWQAGVCLFFAGMAWVGVLVNITVAARLAAPDWMRGRVVSFYLLAFQGSLALSGVLWGCLAGVLGVQPCFAVAATGIVAGLALVRPFPLSHPALSKLTS